MKQDKKLNNYFTILNLNINDSLITIKEAYYHKITTLEEKFSQTVDFNILDEMINCSEAYLCLINPVKRALYINSLTKDKQNIYKLTFNQDTLGEADYVFLEWLKEEAHIYQILANSFNIINLKKKSSRLNGITDKFLKLSNVFKDSYQILKSEYSNEFNNQLKKYQN